MFSHAPPYTYHPNYLDLFHYFASPGGSLLWDILLQALGILFTVVILQRILDHREKMRWRPAQQDLYRRLFSRASWLIKGLPSDVREGWPQTAYKFGYGASAEESTPRSAEGSGD